MTPQTVVFIAFLMGVLPALLWLAFWLLEDRCEPEPKRFIFFAFVGGAAVVWAALYLERLVMPHFAGIQLYFLWALIEEALKFGAAYFVALQWRVFDEPIDAVVYMVTVALGFAAMENMLFLLSPLGAGDTLKAIITGDLRFVGATLLHTLSSATVGISLALAYYQRARVRKIAAAVGLILAVLLHTLFNFFILATGGSSVFGIFLVIWVGIVAILLLVEKVKQPARDYC